MVSPEHKYVKSTNTRNNVMANTSTASTNGISVATWYTDAKLRTVASVLRLLGGRHATFKPYTSSPKVVSIAVSETTTDTATTNPKT